MLFAEGGEVPAWMYFVFGTVGTAVAGSVAWVLKWQKDAKAQDRKDDKEDRTDALREYKELLELERQRCDEALGQRDKEIARIQKRVDDQDAYIKTLLADCGEAKRAEAEQRGKVSRLELELRHAVQELRAVQAVIGKYPPGVTIPCQVIADSKGIIKWVSGSSMDMFGWLPSELEGKNISILMPRDISVIHNRSMEKMFREKRKIDPTKLIRSRGVTKMGKEFPVSVNLSAAAGLDLEYITAEIRRYGDSDVILMGPNGGNVPGDKSEGSHADQIPDHGTGVPRPADREGHPDRQVGGAS